MLAELRIELKADNKITYYQSSNFQGVIMEKIDTEYVATLHSLSLNPYSQHIEVADRIVWVIDTYTDEAYEKILVPLLGEDFNSFELTGKNIKIEVLGKELKKCQKKILTERFYNDASDRYINLDFITPTSFKSNEEYQLFPSLELIYKSLMNKYGSSGDMQMNDSDTLEEMLKNSRIVKYRLKSCVFPIEKVKIPGFMGTITIKIAGKQTIANYIRMLLEFGEYSGVGIKCSMGMGAMRIRKVEKEVDRRTD